LHIAEILRSGSDTGYYKGEDIAACEAAGVEAYVSRPQCGFAVREGLFRKEEFRYDAQSDMHICPGNQQLIRASVRPVESMIGSIIVIVTPVGVASSRVAVPLTRIDRSHAGRTEAGFDKLDMLRFLRPAKAGPSRADAS
jgi:hypothetical protein